MILIILTKFVKNHVFMLDFLNDVGFCEILFGARAN